MTGPQAFALLAAGVGVLIGLTHFLLADGIAASARRHPRLWTRGSDQPALWRIGGVATIVVSVLIGCLALAGFLK